MIAVPVVARVTVMSDDDATEDTFNATGGETYTISVYAMNYSANATDFYFRYKK